MSLFDQIGSALKSPMAQGLLGAAAFGFNPALGLLAAPGISNARKAQETAQSAAQLELEAKAEALAMARQQREQAAIQQAAMQNIPRLMASAPPPVMNMDGSFSQPGMDQFRQRAMGLLSRAAPEQMTQSLFDQVLPQQQQNEPTAIREMRALGIPITQEGFAAYQAHKRDPMSGGIDQLTIQKLFMDLEEGRRRQGERASAADQAAALDTVGTTSTLETMENIVSNIDLLGDGFLEPGSGIEGGLRFGAGLLGKTARFFGADEFADKVTAQATASDSLGKDIGAALIGLQRQVGADTDQARAAVARAFASPGMTPEAIRSTLAREVRSVLNVADAKGTDVPNRERWESLVERLSPQRRRLGDSLPGYSDLSPEEQRELDELLGAQR